MSKQTNILIGPETIEPGTRKTISLSVPKLYDWTPINMPVHITHGKTAGPVLCIFAAIHGDEVNGVEVIRRLLKKSILKDIKGTLIAVPIVNVYGFLNQDRYLPDRRDLNRSFPGSKAGSLASRLAYVINNELLVHATHLIDLHSGSFHRNNLPQIRTNTKNSDPLNMAKSFCPPVILHSKEREGSLRQLAESKNITSILYEAGESLRFDKKSIQMGVNGILSVMKSLKMLNRDVKLPRTPEPAISKNNIWLRATHSGILHTLRGLGKKVKKDDTIAIIANPTSRDEHKIKATHAGIIIGQNNLPLIHEGDPIFNIACFEEPSKVESKIELYEKSYEEGDNL